MNPILIICLRNFDLGEVVVAAAPLPLGEEAAPIPLGEEAAAAPIPLEEEAVAAPERPFERLFERRFERLFSLAPLGEEVAALVLFKLRLYLCNSN